MKARCKNWGDKIKGQIYNTCIFFSCFVILRLLSLATESYNCRQKCCVLRSSENKTCRREPQLEYRRYLCTYHLHLRVLTPGTPRRVGFPRDSAFSDFVFRTRQLPSLTGKKEIAKLCHSPWIALGSTGCPRGRPTGKQMISALRQRRWGSRENYVVDVLCERPRINQSNSELQLYCDWMVLDKMSGTPLA